MTFNGHKVEIYEDISEMPIARYHAYSRYMLVASGVGDSLADIDSHISKILDLLYSDKEKCKQEVLNLRQCFFMVSQEKDIRNKAFLCLVKSVDGKKWDDYSENGIERLYRLISGESVGVTNKEIIRVIDSIDEQLKSYFPQIFASSIDDNMLDYMRKRALLQADWVLNGADHTKEIDELTTNISRHYHPKNFESDKAVVEFDRQFEDMCLILAKEFGNKVKEYSVMEFYSAYLLLEKQNKELKKLKRK